MKLPLWPMAVDFTKPGTDDEIALVADGRGLHEARDIGVGYRQRSPDPVRQFAQTAAQDDADLGSETTETAFEVLYRLVYYCHSVVHILCVYFP